MRALAAIAIVLAGVGASPSVARADDAMTFAATDGGPYRLDAGFFAAMPAGLPSGIEDGAVIGATRACGCAFAYGARIAVTGITESSEAYTASDIDVRARATAALRHAVGRTELALRLGAGANIVYEDRTRNGGDRAGLTGDALETRTLAALPAADLEAVIAMHVIGPWLVIASGGPTAEILDGGLHGGFVAGVGIGWQP